MPTETEEIAKATQEVAKTASDAIKATTRLGSFVARVIGEPLDSTVGILSDKLKFIRWERQLRLYDRMDTLLESRGVKEDSSIVPPKLALPIIENASLEEDDILQDLWADLLASAMDPKNKGVIRSAYIEIIKQLEVIDAQIMLESFIQYQEYKKNLWLNYSKDRWTSPSYHELNSFALSQVTTATDIEFEAAIDNLMRLRLLTPYINSEEIHSTDSEESSTIRLTSGHEHDSICLTTFGYSFVEACMKHKINNQQPEEDNKTA